MPAVHKGKRRGGEGGQRLRNGEDGKGGAQTEGEARIKGWRGRGSPTNGECPANGEWREKEEKKEKQGKERKGKKDKKIIMTVPSPGRLPPPRTPLKPGGSAPQTRRGGRPTRPTRPKGPRGTRSPHEGPRSPHEEPRPVGSGGRSSPGYGGAGGAGAPPVKESTNKASRPSFAKSPFLKPFLKKASETKPVFAAKKQHYVLNGAGGGPPSSVKMDTFPSS